MKKLGVSAAHITIEINTDSQAGYSLHVPSDESISNFNNWFFHYDFGDWEAEEFETAFCTVIQLKVELIKNKLITAKVNELIKSQLKLLTKKILK